MANRLKQRIAKLLPGKSTPHCRPIVSIVLVVYDMPAQAENTVRSLLADYQIGVSPADYEVLIVENESANNMSREFIDTLPGNFSYHLRRETLPTPIYAINCGIKKARGRNVCVMIDGARVVTPGVIKNTILGHRLCERSVVTVPGYHLGFELQQKSVSSGYTIERERELMRSINWPENGYRLFDIACFSGSCAPGFYLPHSESNCISMPRTMWNDLGGYDPRFDKRGGGVVNLDLYVRACEYPGATHIFLHGEGTFHQFHGGVTTGGEDAEARERFIDEIMEQYRQIRGKKFESPETDPLYLGELSDPALRFVQISADRKLERLGVHAEAQQALA
ncbi:MAG: glycosyltransferase [Halioglobus sp.]|nr:glycosyltransferase [Halioglobus sp.]